MTNHRAEDTETVEGLTSVLIDALRALGVAGQPDSANRLAGLAWAALRHQHPRQAQRVNALMHKLARLPETNKEQTCRPPTRSSTSAASRPPAATS